MNFSIKVNTIKLEWSIVYIEGSSVNFQKIFFFLSLMIDFILANSANPDEMPPYAAFHLGLNFLL